MDVDGVEDNGTARDELVEAEIEGTARFGGLGEFFVPCDLCIGERKEGMSEGENQKQSRDDDDGYDGKRTEAVYRRGGIELNFVMMVPSSGSTA